jgi:hypothetical protein
MRRDGENKSHISEKQKGYFSQERPDDPDQLDMAREFGFLAQRILGHHGGAIATDAD